MQNCWKRLFRGGMLALSGLSLSLMASSASAQTVDEIISRGKLIVAIDTTTPPYGFLDADLKPTGFDIEVANKMGEALGVPVEFVTVTSPGRIPVAAHQAGRRGHLDLLDHRGPRHPDRLFDPLCRTVGRRDRAEEHGHQEPSRTSSARRSA